MCHVKLITTYFSMYLLVQRVVDILVKHGKKSVPTSINEDHCSLKDQASKVLQDWAWIVTQCINVLQEWFMIVLTWKVDKVRKL